jgi:hypothetical protein
MTNGLEQAVGLGEVIEPVLRGTQAWPMSGSVMGGVLDEAGGAPLDAPLASFLVGCRWPAGVGLDGVEAALDDLDQQQVGGDHPKQDEEEADRQGGEPEEAC